MTLQNCEIFASVVFLLLAKIVSYIVDYYRLSMFNKSGTVLTSIPEKNEEEEIKKWVPKKKHEVLKAKYKCLKKLFQIYDASVIGILPENPETYENDVEETKVKSRRKRSHRTKTDACAGTTEISSGDVTEMSDTEKGSTIATTVMRELKMTQCSCTSTQYDSTTVSNRYATTHNSISKSIITDKESECVQANEPEPPETIQHPIPYLMVNEKPKLTRFQCFIQRIFGIKREKSYKNFVTLNGHIYAASDNNITPHYSEKRRRRGLRFRKLRRPKKIQSESALRNVKSPMILTYVQSVQKNCLMDTTPRQCPIMGCRMIFYGIINYNDHLNLCHFTERKYICHYCHEGFEREYDKYLHENEHIGINKISSSVPTSSRQTRKASITQTDPELTKCDVPEDKLKKIVSFFDKITDPDQILSEIKKNRFSESNLQGRQLSKDDTITDNTSSNSETDKRTVSCMNLHRKGKCPSPPESDTTSKFPYNNAPVTCHFCGENFDYRRQLSLHVDLEHRVHDKFSKFHSCAGIMNPRHHTTEEGKVTFKTQDRRSNPSEDTLRRKSEESLSYEPSTNIVYYTSVESVDSKKRPVSYKWEPGTKIIRV
ncbi:hypothetical protein ABMA27_011069 [Loxostege sticticalis]|uniref:C2H2-type domain-containing protein n=1 Tax=Loxostege sticticalis TaxID=481309 RepID=A0ABR3H381_LOXSC